MPERHIDYLEWLVENLGQWLPPGKGALDAVLPYRDDLLALALLDLEPAREVLEECYAPQGGGGRPRKDPVAMLRSLLLMLRVGETGINDWVARVDREPMLAVLAGFLPAERPGVGTFYDFFDRLESGKHRKECEHYKRPSTQRRGARGRFRRNLKREKEQAKAARKALAGPTQEAPAMQAAKRALQAREQPPPDDLLGRIERILLRCGLEQVAKAGLVGDIGHLNVAGDGSALESHANGRGHRLCTCHEDGEGRCDCDRTYSDPSARWGWDSYRERFYFGYRFHALVVRIGSIEVPLHIMLDGANTADVLMGITSLARLERQLRQCLPEAHIEHAIFDAGYDATAFHRFVAKIGAKPVIALNPKNFKPLDPDGIPRNDQGVPLCPGGAPMRRHGYSKKTFKCVYNCPAKRPGRENGRQIFKIRFERCPNASLCEPDTKMGPLVHLSLDDDPRLNPPVPRGSDRFLELYRKRTCTERHFSTAHGKGLADSPYRRQHIFHVMALVHALDRYVHLWLRALGEEEVPNTLGQTLDWLGRLIGNKRQQRQQEDKAA